MGVPFNRIVHFEGRHDPKVEKKTTIIIIIGALVVALGAALMMFFFHPWGRAFGAILFFLVGPAVIVVGAVIYSKNLIFLSGTEYDQKIEKKLHEARPDIREYLGIDESEVEEIEPITFEGYKYVGAKKLRKDPEDNLWRTDLYEKATIFFTANELHLYKVSYDCWNDTIGENTDVYFYEDVVSVSTNNEVEKVANNTINYISFKLVSRGGNSLSIALKADDNIQRSVNAMRALIKEKKS